MSSSSKPSNATSDAPARSGSPLGQLLSGPDAQPLLTDYIDYTERLPSDLCRSLTLIRKLDESYLRAVDDVHRLTKIYGACRSGDSTQAQAQDRSGELADDPVALRRQISHALDRAVNLRQCAYAEAARLYDVVDRGGERLNCVKGKLLATMGATLTTLQEQGISVEDIWNDDIGRQQEEQNRVAELQLPTRAGTKRRAGKQNDIAQTKKQQQLSMDFPTGSTSLAQALTPSVPYLSQTPGHLRVDVDGGVEKINPHEPRYCLCDDISYGTMICCEDDNVSNFAHSAEYLLIFVLSTHSRQFSLLFVFTGMDSKFPWG